MDVCHLGGERHGRWCGQLVDSTVVEAVTSGVSAAPASSTNAGGLRVYFIVILENHSVKRVMAVPGGDRTPARRVGTEFPQPETGD